MPYNPVPLPASGHQDLGVNAYGTVGGGTLTQKIFSQYDLYKPNELLQVFERHGYKPSFRLMLRAMGFTRGTAKPTTGHYEYPWRKNTIKFGAIITPSAGAGTNVVVELDPASMFNTGATVSGVASQGSYPVVRDILHFRDGRQGQIIAKDTSVNPHRLTIRPLQAATDLATSIVVGEDYFVATAAFAEGSNLPSGRVPRILKYTNDFQITKAAAAVTGSELTNQTYFDPVPNMPGSYFLKVSDLCIYYFEEYYDGGLMWGQTINNITEFNPVIGHDLDVKGTEGLIEFATTNGFTDTYTVGAYALSDFTTVSNYLERERVNWRELLCLQGCDIRNEIEEVIGGVLDGDLAALLTKKWLYGDMVGEGFSENFMSDDQPYEPGDYALNISFRAVKKGGFNYGFFTMNAFNEAMGAGAVGYDYPNWQVMIPVGYMAEKSTGTNKPTVGYEYKELNGYSREQIAVKLEGAGTGEPVVTPYDIRQIGMIGEFAFHATCGNCIVIQRPA